MCTHTCTHTYMYIHTYVHTYIRTYIHTYIYTLCRYVYIHIMYSHTYTSTGTYLHLHTCTPPTTSIYVNLTSFCKQLGTVSWWTLGNIILFFFVWHASQTGAVFILLSVRDRQIFFQRIPVILCKLLPSCLVCASGLFPKSYLQRIFSIHWRLSILCAVHCIVTLLLARKCLKKCYIWKQRQD